MKYPCLIVDHDDTVVNSTATVHYPCFVEYTRRYFPDYHCTLKEYFIKNFDPGVVAFFRDEVGMSEAQMRHEQAWWNKYVQSHIPQVYPGMKDILWEQKRRGGLLCVVSHSLRENILRDYRENALPEPDLVFGWECPAPQRKPSPWPLEQIMQKYRLQSDQLLVLDDLKPGYDMAHACGVPFAAAGWANDIPEIERFMRDSCELYFKTVVDFGSWLFE
ncbi:MAG: HAD hydrolase-like protein [Clostridia bacterium]|nr:HAD hydrolase-like protein [Clostridia bacterium]